MRRSTASRSGFTLVELLVAMGLTMFIMVILVEAFTAGLATFQELRSMGGLQNQARSALQLMRNDLQQSHFEGSRMMSDTNFWKEPRREGFFLARQGTAPSPSNPLYKDEGPDLDAKNPELPGSSRSYIARDHVLHFASRLRGNRRENFVFDGTAVAGFVSLRTSLLRVLLDATYGVDLVASTSTTFSSQWSEIAYVMVPATDPQPQTIDVSGAVLHNLYRINLLVVPYTDFVNNVSPIPFSDANFQLTSRTKTEKNNFQFFSPNDLAKGKRSFNPAGAMDNANLRGKSLVCTNVVSFQVRILQAGAKDYSDIPGNTLDTALAPPPGVDRVLGIQVILRVFDPSTGLTRQVTLIQDM